METAESNQIVLKFPPLEECKTSKNYDDPEVLRHTFETLSNLHMLLPNHLIQLLCCYRNGLDEQKCMWVEGEDLEFGGLERILASRQFPKEIYMTPKPSNVPLWKRKIINNENHGWKRCHLLNKRIKDPPMSTIVVRWLKRNMKPTEDLQSVIQKLSNFGPIKSVSLCGQQSAIVVFENTTSACNAVSAFHSRTPGTMVQCSWQQPFMSKVVRVPLPKTYVSFSFFIAKMFIVKWSKTKESKAYIQMKCMTPTWISEYIVDFVPECQIPTMKAITEYSYHAKVKFNLPCNHYARFWHRICSE